MRTGRIESAAWSCVGIVLCGVAQIRGVCGVQSVGSCSFDPCVLAPSREANLACQVLVFLYGPCALRFHVLLVLLLLGTEISGERNCKGIRCRHTIHFPEDGSSKICGVCRGINYCFVVKATTPSSTERPSGKQCASLHQKLLESGGVVSLFRHSYKNSCAMGNGIQVFISYVFSLNPLGVNVYNGRGPEKL